MFGQIAIKLRKFIRLYYLNRILAGILLWLSGAVTFFVLLVLLEQSLWLDKATKTILVSTSGVAFVVFWYRLVGRFFWKWIKPGFGMKPIDAAKLIADRDKTVGDQLVNLVLDYKVVKIMHLQDIFSLKWRILEKYCMIKKMTPFINI